MRAADWAVLIAGIAAIIWVNWYFLFADRDETPQSPAERDASSHDHHVAGARDTRR